jgi:3-deoxy-D-manno-octulosonate 8-phosphate phosphatase (KDO 8-P phosphatase)
MKRAPTGQSLHRQSSIIRALFFDVDGVLTDGRVYLSDDGHEFKVFDTKDGHGVKKAIAAGLKVAWISGRASAATARRARELGVRECRQGVSDKAEAYREICRRWKVAPRETAAMGDDEPDVPMLEAAGFSACPADAAPAARRAARILLKNRGGRGAVREFVEWVLAFNRRSSPARSGEQRPARRRAPGRPGGRSGTGNRSGR